MLELKAEHQESLQGVWKEVENHYVQETERETPMGL